MIPQVHSTSGCDAPDRPLSTTAFEDGSGNSVIDNGTGGPDACGTDNSNCLCPDGGCLWFDGTNDVARVEVDDYVEI